jgi:pimeloyl-ACP methyl ester carboxylesterase
MSTAPLVTLLLPGLDGTGTMFRRFVAALPASIDPRVVAYPSHEVRGYRGLESIALAHAPAEGPWAIVAESFAGPLAIRIAARAPAGLVALVLVAAFVRAPVSRWMARLRFFVRPWVFAAPPPEIFVRAMMTGTSADDELVADFRASVASVSPHVLSARVREVLDVDVEAELARVRTPMLYLEAEHDTLLRKGIAGELSALRPEMEHACIDAPHLVLQRRPREAAKIIAPFLARARENA